MDGHFVRRNAAPPQLSRLGQQNEAGFLAYRLQSLLGTLAAILLSALVLLFEAVLLPVLQLLIRLFADGGAAPGHAAAGLLLLSRLLTPVLLFLALWLLLRLLQPPEHRPQRSWPGALLASLLWVLATLLLPRGIAAFADLGLTYGTLSGVMFTLLFFYAIGLALMLGIELNAALADLFRSPGQ